MAQKLRKMSMQFGAHPVEQKWLPRKSPTNRISDSCFCIVFNLIILLNCFRVLTITALYKHSVTLNQKPDTIVRWEKSMLNTEFSLLHGARNFYHQPLNSTDMLYGSVVVSLLQHLSSVWHWICVNWGESFLLYTFRWKTGSDYQRHLTDWMQIFLCRYAVRSVGRGSGRKWKSF